MSHNYSTSWCLPLHYLMAWYMRGVGHLSFRSFFASVFHLSLHSLDTHKGLSLINTILQRWLLKHLLLYLVWSSCRSSLSQSVLDIISSLFTHIKVRIWQPPNVTLTTCTLHFGPGTLEGLFFFVPARPSLHLFTSPLPAPPYKLGNTKPLPL